MSTDDNEKSSDQRFPSDLKERYVEARLEGVGGMGRVFSATDTRLAKRVAIKLLPRSNENAQTVIRFQQEAKAVSKLNNKHIVQVMDFGFTTGGEPFLVMEFITGETLATLITRSGQLPIKQVIEIAGQIASGLEHAHGNGVIHRDLKPGNIMIDKNNCVRILDFGLAKILSQEETHWKLTKPGQPVGSVLYMSPEQFQGAETDERTDVYALGLVIYKMVTGQVPFENDNIMELARKRREEAPPAIPPRIDAEQISVKLERVLRTALSIEPEQRFASMSAFNEALSKCLSSQTSEMTAPQVPNKPKATPILLAITGLLLVAAGVAVIAIQNRPKPVKQEIAPPPVPVANYQDQTDKPPPGYKVDDDDGTKYWVLKDNEGDEAVDRLHGSGVTHLSFQSNKEISDNSIKRLANIPLQALCLRSTSIDDGAIEDLNKLNLIGLSLRQTRITEKGIMRLSGNPNLESLDLKYLPATDRCIQYVVKKFPKLMHLNIGETNVTRKCLQYLAPLKDQLVSVYAEGVPFTDADVDTLVGLGVEKIELADSKVTRNCIAKLLKMKKLEWLSLAACEGITPADVAELQRRFPAAVIVPPKALEPDEDLMKYYGTIE